MNYSIDYNFLKKEYESKNNEIAINLETVNVKIILIRRINYYYLIFKNEKNGCFGLTYFKV